MCVLCYFLIEPNGSLIHEKPKRDNSEVSRHSQGFRDGMVVAERSICSFEQRGQLGDRNSAYVDISTVNRLNIKEQTIKNVSVLQ
jgi:hypothetical protein